MMSASRVRGPWRPLTVSMLAFFLPAGGAILTIRNLERLEEITPKAARKLLLLTGVVFAFGLAFLVLVAQKDKSGHLVPDSGAYLILSVGVAMVSYLAQRPAFRAWQSTHSGQRNGSLLEAIGLTIFYYLLTAACAAPLILIAAQISGVNLGLTPQ